MRARIVIFAALCLGGCAAAPRSQHVVVVPEETLASDQAEPAAALVFNTPLGENETPVELTRDERQPAAFVGFDGPITTSFWIYTDDMQDTGRGGSGRNGGTCGPLGDRYQREAIMEQTGVRTR